MKGKVYFLRSAVMLLLFLCSMISGTAGIIHIPQDYSTIQEGIDAAVEGDTVLVDEGTYYENINFRGKHITVAGKFLLDRDEGHIPLTVIDGSQPADPDSGSVVIMMVGDTTAVLCGFTLTGGSGTRTLVDIESSSWNSRGGGGVTGTGGKIENCIVHGNSVNATGDIHPAGGGIVCWPTYGDEMNIVIRNNKIFDNHIMGEAYVQGAGIASGCEGGVTIIEKNEIYDNESICPGEWKANAGGIFVASTIPWESKMLIRNNLIKDNRIECQWAQGAGIFLTYPPYREEYRDFQTEIMIYNNIIMGNSSTDAGGGIAVWDQNSTIWESPALVIMNNTIIGNKAIRGGGIFNFRMNILQMNNILYNDLSAEESEEFFYKNYHSYPNLGKFQSYNNNIQNMVLSRWDFCGDPCPEKDDFILSDSSICIDRGIDSVVIGEYTFYAPEKDFYGNPRPYSESDNPGTDLGAVESEYELQDHFNIQVQEEEGRGLCNGKITVVVEGGIPPFRYYLNQEESLTNEFDDLCGGEYEIMVMDTAGNTGTAIASLVSIDNDIAEAEINIFPNPATDNLHLEISGSLKGAQTEFNLYSVQGELIMKEYFRNKLEINIRDLAPGIYFYRLKCKEKVRTGKWAKR